MRGRLGALHDGNAGIRQAPPYRHAEKRAVDKSAAGGRAWRQDRQRRSDALFRPQLEDVLPHRFGRRAAGGGADSGRASGSARARTVLRAQPRRGRGEFRAVRRA
jgi:hypothetical protein